MLAVVVETGPLIETIVASLVAGIGITVVFSIAIWGAARFVALSRDDRPIAAGAAAIVGVLALVATLAAVVGGIGVTFIFSVGIWGAGQFTELSRNERPAAATAAAVVGAVAFACVAAAVILASTHFGFPLSTTHVINGGVMGAGAGKRVSAVRWGVAGNIFMAWLLTLPAAAAIGAAVYGFTHIFGSGALGPVLVTLMALSLIIAAFARRAQRGAPVTAAGG